MESLGPISVLVLFLVVHQKELSQLGAVIRSGLEMHLVSSCCVSPHYVLNHCVHILAVSLSIDLFDFSAVYDEPLFQRPVALHHKSNVAKSKR